MLTLFEVLKGHQHTSVRFFVAEDTLAHLELSLDSMYGCHICKASARLRKTILSTRQNEKEFLQFQIRICHLP